MVLCWAGRQTCEALSLADPDRPGYRARRRSRIRDGEEKGRQGKKRNVLVVKEDEKSKKEWVAAETKGKCQQKELVEEKERV